MLAIAMAARADELDLQNGGDHNTLDCCVAIHGPDKIRDPFESFQRSFSRLDIMFAHGLAQTMIRSGCTRILPDGSGRGLHEEWVPWLSGWGWMKSYTSSIFHRPWEDMENELWSCEGSMSVPLKTPVLRIISANDPIIWYNDCIDESLFCNLDKVVVQKAAGHCPAFDFDELATIVKEWRDTILDL